jgi:sortase A
VSTAPADLLRTAARGVGQLLLTAGYVLLLFVVYELWVTDLLSNARQDELTAELREEWAAPAAVPAELQGGEAFAMLHIPRLGADYARAVVEGVGAEALEQGPVCPVSRSCGPPTCRSSRRRRAARRTARRRAPT